MAYWRLSTLEAVVRGDNKSVCCNSTISADADATIATDHAIGVQADIVLDDDIATVCVDDHATMYPAVLTDRY